MTAASAAGIVKSPARIAPDPSTGKSSMVQTRQCRNGVNRKWTRRPRGVAEKCAFCYQRIDRGLSLGLEPGVDANATPACVVVCPTGARVFGDVNDPNSKVSQLLQSHASYRLREDLGTGPRVYYLPADATRNRRVTMLKKLRFQISSIRFTPWILWLCFLGLLLLIALIGGIVVFWNGLWITNLTDLVPWGLWITIDLSSIALSAGAFSLCAAVYLIGLKRYEPIARTATFVGLIGYTMAMLALVLDIGRPDRFWHAMVYWNEHSLLWEVTMCVMLYLTVLVFEAMPIFAGFSELRKRFPKAAAWMSHLHHYAPYLAVAGLCLSMLHQSSLGATYGVLKAHPFWYKPEMSVLFMYSALVGGISLTLFASMLSARLTSRARINDGLIERVSLLCRLGSCWLSVLPLLGCPRPDLHLSTRANRGFAATNEWSALVQLLGFGDVAGYGRSDDHAPCTIHAQASVLAHARPWIGGDRRDCLPLGYKPLRAVDRHVISAWPTYGFLYFLLSFPGGIYYRFWHHRLRPSRFLIRRPLP